MRSILHERKSVTLTGYSGCDITLESEGKEVGWIQALTWDKEKIIKGKIIIVQLEDFELPLSIRIKARGEMGVLLEEYLLHDVELFFTKGKNKLNQIHSFEAQSITKEST